MIKHIGQILKFRELLKNFVVRDLKLKYKNSILGYFWSLLDPLLTMLLFIVVFSVFMKIPVENYPAFLITGILPWNFLQMSLNGSLMSLVQSRQLIRKIYFPRQLLPYSVVITYFVNLLLSFIVLIPILVIYKIEITLYVLYLPLALVFITLLTLGLSLFLSSLFVFFYDTLYASNSVIRLWFYLSPIIYPISKVPEAFRNLYMLNPMAPILSLFRAGFLGTPPPPLFFILYAGLVSIFLFITGAFFFHKSENSMVKII
jgi:lipopolysaccharide transport system permease protein